MLRFLARDIIAYA